MNEEWAKKPTRLLLSDPLYFLIGVKSSGAADCSTDASLKIRCCKANIFNGSPLEEKTERYVPPLRYRPDPLTSK